MSDTNAEQTEESSLVEDVLGSFGGPTKVPQQEEEPDEAVDDTVTPVNEEEPDESEDEPEEGEGEGERAPEEESETERLRQELNQTKQQFQQAMELVQRLTPQQEAEAEAEGESESEESSAAEEAMASLDLDADSLDAALGDPEKFKGLLEKTAEIASNRATKEAEERFDTLLSQRQEAEGRAIQEGKAWVRENADDLREHANLQDEFKLYVRGLQDTGMMEPGNEKKLLDQAWQYTKKQAQEWAKRLGKEGNGNQQKQSQAPGSVAPTSGGSRRTKSETTKKQKPQNKVEAVLGDLKDKGTFGVM